MHLSFGLFSLMRAAWPGGESSDMMISCACAPPCVETESQLLHKWSLVQPLEDRSRYHVEDLIREIHCLTLFVHELFSTQFKMNYVFLSNRYKGVWFRGRNTFGVCHHDPSYSSWLILTLHMRSKAARVGSASVSCDWMLDGIKVNGTQRAGA